MVTTRALVLFFVLLAPIAAVSAESHGKFARHYPDSLFKVTDHGRYSVEVIVKEHALQVGKNALDVIVHDDKNRDVVDAEVRVLPRMAGMEDGSAPAAVVEKGGGLYRAENVVLKMEGRWELSVAIKKDAVADAAVFVFQNVPRRSAGAARTSIGTETRAIKYDAPRRFDMSTSRQTANFRVAYTSDAMPIPVNRFHTWRLKITTPQGEPVKGATISIDGDMPEHGHGLPTKPEVTREIADGVYVVEGLKFTMPGHWLMKFDIAANGKEDEAAFDLMLK